MTQHEHTKAVLNRLSRAIGHLGAIKKMVEDGRDGRDCSEILIQLSAVKSQIVGTSKVVLKDHLEHCVKNAVEERNDDAIRQLQEAIDRLL